MNRSTNFILAVLLILPSILLAQKEQKHESKATFIVSTDLLHYFNDTYRIDIEGKKTDSHFSHFLSVDFLNGNTNNRAAWLFHSGTDPVSGIGLGIHQKWVSKRGNNKSCPYIAYGINLRKVSIRYSEVGFSRYTENSLDYYSYGPYDDEIEIKSGVANVIGGIQLTHSTNIVLDSYLGVAYKLSDSKSGNLGYKEYNKSFSSFGSEGLGFQMGVKLGFKIH
ncbi:hypothetical protein [Desertivirga brevis]|uniref:hypothetical protein n=1 Tax=Desertivirga brevis TaxID=2810310 RepID=UPI001A961431|nr:hypothetical protein [Pedobacter sp. SYSU D00873]